MYLYIINNKPTFSFGRRDPENFFFQGITSNHLWMKAGFQNSPRTAPRLGKCVHVINKPIHSQTPNPTLYCS